MPKINFAFGELERLSFHRPPHYFFSETLWGQWKIFSGQTGTNERKKEILNLKKWGPVLPTLNSPYFGNVEGTNIFSGQKQHKQIAKRNVEFGDVGSCRFTSPLLCFCYISEVTRGQTRFFS